MGRWVYRKEGDSKTQEICVVCKEKKQKPYKGRFLPYCSSCQKKLYQKTFKSYDKRKYRPYVKTYCERCSFIAIDLCQLDVHHKDHNHENNDPSNLETLCANCHRLEHKNNPERN